MSWNSGPRTRCSAEPRAGSPGCERTARGRGLCQGHLQRWNDQGRPDMERFVASTDPRWRRQQPEPAVPGARLRLRLCARRNVRAARAAMGTRRPPRPGRVAGRTAAGQAARRGRDLPHPALRALAAGDLAVLPNPHQHLEGERATRHRRVRGPLRRRDPAGQRDDPARPAGPAAEAGDAVRAATPPRRPAGQAHPRRGHARGAGTRRRGTWARCSTTTKTPGTSELGCRSTTLAPAGSSATPAG